MSKRYLPAAYSAAVIIRHVLTNELKLTSPVRFVLTETREGRAFLFAVMDDKALGGKIGKYTNGEVLHQLSTALQGMPVKLSNTTGLRYAAELSPKRQLPAKSLYSGSANGLINLGAMRAGRDFLLDPQVMQNVLLVGDMGSGKSNLLRLMAIAGLENGFDLLLADPEENTFGGAFWDSVCVNGRVAGSQADFIDTLHQISKTLDERRALYQSVTTGMVSPNSLAEYNAVAATPLNRLILIADEANSYLDDLGTSKHLFELARRARKWGVNLILAAHSWRGTDISTSLRSMLATRIALPSTEKESVNVVFGNGPHAKRVLNFKNPGRGLIRYNGVYSDFQTHLIPEDYQIAGGKRLTNAQFEALIIASLARPEEAGKMEIAFCMQTLSITNRQATALLLDMENQGLLEKRADKANARYLTQKARDLLSNQKP